MHDSTAEETTTGQAGRGAGDAGPLGADPQKGSYRLLMGLVGLLLVGLVVAFVLGTGGSTTTNEPSEPTSTATPTSPAVASKDPEVKYPEQTPGPAPDFEFTTFDGATVSLSSLRGTPVVLNFWASWCIPCRKEMPAFQQASDELGGKVAFVGLASQDGETDARRFADANSIHYTLGLAPDGIADSMGVYGLPSTFLIDPNGMIVEAHFGELSHDELTAKLRKYGFA